MTNNIKDKNYGNLFLTPVQDYLHQSVNDARSELMQVRIERDKAVEIIERFVAIRILDAELIEIKEEAQTFLSSLQGTTLNEKGK